ncbi:mitochondrial glycerol-3-phosphate dehydrogenase [Borealophlyctis nickersoniae]|nr:mitochondrial glycerol-3-phosphate dehydrogenase [Borealophlyctis nickersoniae]
MWRSFSRPTKIAVASAATGASATLCYLLDPLSLRSNSSSSLYAASLRPAFLHAEGAERDKEWQPHSLWMPPSRKEMLGMLQGDIPIGSVGKGSDPTTPAITPSEGAPSPAAAVSAKPTDGKKRPAEFDLLIIGGGATGTGCALDAVTRGLKVALVERDDFGSGTSSRSTKLVHGGVRYLEKAFMELDYEQYKLVKEALHERGVFLKIAPYLSYQLPIMLPIYQLWKVPYYWAGSKAYDFIAKLGGDSISQSYFLGKAKALEAFPMLKTDKLVGAMVYYDGAHNDSRMNVAIALTAIAHGAVVANHVEVVKLLKKERTTFIGRFGFGKEELYGAILRDNLTGEEWEVRAKGIINATGPFTDGIRKLDSGPSVKEIVAPSAGVHIILPNYYSPRNMGLIDPSTSDGRVIFFLPWQGGTIAGTTDSPTAVTANPMPTEEEIQWILHEVENYLSPEIKVRRGDVLAAWSGIRPLVRDPAAKNTAALVRNHMINVSPSGLLTIAGGKWTTYRAMAEETIDKAIEVFDLKPTGPCATEHVLLLGTHNWSKNMFVKLIQHFGLETEVAQHLAASYGDRAWAVASLASLTGQRWPVFGRKISPSYPYIEAEVRYAVLREYACTVVDVIARRTRLSFLNATATLEALPRIIDIMASELDWDEARKVQELTTATSFLTSMGLPLPTLNPSSNSSTSAPKTTSYPTNQSGTLIIDDPAHFYTRSHFSPAELARYQKEFEKLDHDRDGHISERDLGRVLEMLGIKMTEREMEGVIKEVDLNCNGSVEFNEFLEVLAAVKEIKSRSRFARIVAAYEERENLSTERSGGGV